MKLIFRVCTIIFIVLIMTGITYANKDRKGSSDYPLISRMPGFWIAVYEENEYDSYTFRDSANNKITIKGHKYFIVKGSNLLLTHVMVCDKEKIRVTQTARSAAVFQTSSLVSLVTLSAIFSNHLKQKRN